MVVETREAVYAYEIDSDPEDLVVGFDDVWVIDKRPTNPVPCGVQPTDASRLLTGPTAGWSSRAQPPLGDPVPAPRLADGGVAAEAEHATGDAGHLSG